MMDYDTLQEFVRDGFNVTVEARAEDMALCDFFDETAQEMAEMERKVHYGIWDWFQLRVRVHQHGVELGRAHLGACLYADRADVLCDGVADDVIQEALVIAHECVTKLRDQLPEAA